MRIVRARNFAVRSWRGFTLIELLVVMGIVVVLLGILLPSLAGARHAARRTVCLSNLRQIGTAIYSYANDNQGRIPFGPKAPPMFSPADFYPSTGAVTSLVSLSSGAPVAMGLLLKEHLSRQPKVLFCPEPDQDVYPDAELARVGIGQAQSSYYYRHASMTALFDNPNLAAPPADHIVLNDLGLNSNGLPISALAIDTMFLCTPDLAQFNVLPRTQHQQKFANVLCSDGHAVTCSNADGRFTVDITDLSQIRSAFSKILQVLERADVEK